MSDAPRPPYVTFEDRSIEDRDATLEAGHFVGKSIHMAIITPPGSKDNIEKEATTWLKDSARSAKDGRIPMEWVTYYEKMYDNFKLGLEEPENGTPIMTWPAVNRAQAQTILAANIRTVEDLAEANEVALATIGMGAVALKQKARAFLEVSDSKGKPAERIASLEVQVSSLTNANVAKDKKIAELERKVEDLSKENA